MRFELKSVCINYVQINPVFIVFVHSYAIENGQIHKIRCDVHILS